MEKPDGAQAQKYLQDSRYLINSGLFLFRNGDFLQEVRLHSPEILGACERAFEDKLIEKGKHIFYRREVLEQIPAQAIEETVFEETARCMVVKAGFAWQDVGSLEDLGEEGLISEKDSRQAQYNCDNTLIINRGSRSIVVANQLEDITIVNTDDAVYVGKKGASESLKDLRRENPALQSYFDMGQVIYKPWGTYEILSAARQYRCTEGYADTGTHDLCPQACETDGALDHRQRACTDHAGWSGKRIRQQRQHGNSGKYRPSDF